MARRFCPKCGAELQFSVQKFCTTCGSAIPPEPAPAGRMAGSGPAGVPVWMFALAAVFILGIAGILLLPHLVPAGGSAAAAEAGGKDTVSPIPSSSGKPLSGNTTASLIPTPSTAPVTTQKTTPPQTTAAATTVPATTLAPVPVTGVPTATPEPRATTVITLAQTQVPEQPTASSYTSNNPQAPYIEPKALEVRVHDLVNAQRQQNGLTSLSYDPFLADIARGHSWDMVIRNYFEHDDPGGKSPKDRGDTAGYPCIRVIGRYSWTGISENLYQGVRWNATYVNATGATVIYDWKSLEDVAQQAVNGWMNSPGHRENILTEHYILEGIGVAFSSDDKIYITQNFC